MAKIKVDGHIIKEVCSIPTGTLAITELIKNSYEAKSSYVNIKLHSDKMIIKDDGVGMNSKDMDSLLNISHSEKVFGTRIGDTNRYVSGEKGLGFFSVFKFGNRVNVSTVDEHNKDYIYSFTLNMKDIIQHNDISNMEVEISRKKNINYENGTRIIIDNLKDDIFNVFKDELLNEKGKAVKLCHVINSSDFKIKLNIDGRDIGSESIEPVDKFSKQQIGYINYDSNVNESEVVIKYRNNGNYVSETSFKIENELLKNQDFELKIKLKVYNLQGIGTKDAPEIYLEHNKLNPIVYINNVLFDSQNLYNIEINNTKKSSKVFRQQIGEISIYLKKANVLQFNSDRTAIIENENYKRLIDLLNDISSRSQVELRQLINDYHSKTKVDPQKIERDSKKNHKEINQKAESNQKVQHEVLQKQENETVTSLKSNVNTKIAVKKDLYDFLTLEGYKGKIYRFVNLEPVGELFKEIKIDNSLNKKKGLLYLIIIRPIYEACRNIFEKNNIIEFRFKAPLDEDIEKMRNYILREENKNMLTKVCEKVGENDGMSFSTVRNAFSTINFSNDVKASNIFVHRIGESYKTLEDIKKYLHNVLLFAVIIDRWVTIVKNK